MNDVLFQHGDIGAKGLSTTDKQSLINIANTADADNDTIKTDVVAKVNTALGTSLTNASTWTQIRAAIVKDPDKITANIKAGINIDGVQGKTEVVDTTTAIGAAVGDVIAGKETFVNGAKLVGTIVNNGAGNTVTPGTANQTRAAGFWSSLITILGDSNLVANLIASGKSIFGVVGTMQGYVNLAAPSERSTTSTSPVKVKTLTVSSSGNITVCMDTHTTNGSYWATAQVYKNGSPYGQQNSNANTTYTTTPPTYSENLSCVAGDVFDLYIWVSNGGGGATCYLKNFTIVTTVVSPSGGTVTLN